MAAFTEFYVTCNPPLLPNGVSSIIEQASVELDPAKCIEILYEPDIPWFKMIAASDYQNDIYSWFHSRLEGLLETETGLVEEDSDDDDDDSEVEEQRNKADVDIVVEHPQVIPWPFYQRMGSSDVAEYSPYQYPDAIKALPHKAVWRGLESSGGMMVSTLLSNFDSITKDGSATLGLQKLANSANCEITHNMSGALVYIGSNYRADCVNNAVRKLETLLEFCDSVSSGATHLISTEGLGPFRFFYQYLSQFGLFQRTYIQPHLSEEQPDHYQRLLKGVSLRVESQDSHGRWIKSTKAYLTEAEPITSSFGPFADYAYRPKRKGFKPARAPDCQPAVVKLPGNLELQFVGAHFPENTSPAAEEHLENQNQPEELPARRNGSSGPSLTTVKAATETIFSSPVSSSDVVTSWIASLETVGDCTDSRTTQSSLCEIEENSSRATPEEITLQVPVDNGLLDRLPPTASPLIDAARSKPTDDLVSLAPNSPPRSAMEQYKPFGDFSLLDSHSPPKNFSGSFSIHPAFAETGSGCLSDRRPSEDLRVLECPETNLMDFLDGPIARPLDKFPVMSTPSPHAAPLEADTKDISGMRNDDILAVFEKQEQKEKELFETMRQRAGRNKGSWANIASGPKVQPPPKDSKAPTWAGVASTAQAQPAALANIQSDGDVFGPNIRVKTRSRLSQSQQKSRKQARSESWRSSTPFHTTEAEKSDAVSKARAPAGPPKPSDNICNAANMPGAPIFPESKVLPAQNGSVSASALRISTPRTSGRIDTVSQVSSTQIVPGLDASHASMNKALARARPIGHIEVMQNIRAKLKQLLNILQITPGTFTLEAKFGRVCIQGSAHCMVNMGHGPYLTAEEVQESLKSGDSSIVFHNILTTNGAEADMIPQMAAFKASSWTLFDKEVFYDIFCRHRDDKAKTKIEVNAETFEHYCRCPTEEVSSLVVHCVDRAWDMKVSLTRSDDHYVPKDFKEFAESLVTSMDISTDEKGHVHIKAEQDQTLGYSIAGMNIRHVANYRHGVDGRSCLTITMTRIVKRGDNFRPGMSTYTGFTCPVPVPGEGCPTQWFEAAITSTRAEELLMENVELEVGDKTSWTPEQFQKEGAFDQLCEPTLRMIAQMDEVGRTNNNGFRPKAEADYYDSIGDGLERIKGPVFW
ncbi:hypothetical protein G7046_g5266 [Stylonectria norvegica]|nr:hypothetical protein G7046_g5266 [Stylonectria norvegica]